MEVKYIMIYTSYFGAIRKLPHSIIPISICGKVPKSWNGLQYRKLSPKYNFFMEWKRMHDNEFYIQHFNDEVLSQLDPNKVVEDLYKLSGGKDVALICYEIPSDFCHRHLVAKWLSEHGHSCHEISIIQEI